MERIDEYTLAAFLEGTLPDAERKEVTRVLAKSAALREVLCMAQTCRAAARSYRPAHRPARHTTSHTARTAAPERR